MKGGDKIMWLRTIRKSKGLSQKDCADGLGITQQMFSAIEKGKRRPSVDLAKKISEFFDFEKYGISWAKFYEDDSNTA